MSWPEDMNMLWIKFLSFVSVFCSANLSCSMIVHIQTSKTTKSGRGHIFSEFACFLFITTSPSVEDREKLTRLSRLFPAIPSLDSNTNFIYIVGNTNSLTLALNIYLSNADILLT